MVDIHRQSKSVDLISRVQKDNVIAEQWDKNNNQNNQRQRMFNPEQNKSQIGFQAKKQLNKTNAVRRTSRVGRIEAIQNIDGVDGVSAVEAVSAVQPIIDFSEMGRFDLKQDIAEFVRPEAMIPEYLSKDSLSRTGTNILSFLSLNGASDALIKRAEALLEEENSVKSVTDAYKNALIFA